VTWPLPEVEGAAPRSTRSRLRFVMSRLPTSVITCPGPGSGKTVLLRSWIGQAGAAGLSERVARVPAGRDERDPQRFWLSVLAALRQTPPGSPLVRAVTAAAGPGRLVDHRAAAGGSGAAG